MNRLLFVGAAVVAFAVMGVTRVQSINERVERLDQFTQSLPEREMARDQEMEGLRGEIADLLSELAEVKQDAGAAERIFERRVIAVEQDLEDAFLQLDQMGASEEQRDAIDSMRVETREALAELRAVGERRWADMAESVAVVNQRAESAMAGVDGLTREVVADDAELRWQQIVGPTVQLAGTATVGSAVLLESTPKEDGDSYQTLLLTSWHVVRDIRADSLQEDPPIPVEIHRVDGTVRHETATLICKDVALDAALLVLNSDQEVEYGARLSSPEYQAARRVFHPVYAVGCPLGNDPIPTAGEIIDLHHDIDGVSYWMISAPTYIGNSGGGIYDGRSRKLMGLFSKIYTHGNLRPSVVTHMGLVTPLAPVYEWLEETGKARVVPSGEGEVRIELVDAPDSQAGPEPVAYDRR